MTLLDICLRLEEFSQSGVIFAERIAGDFTPQSRAEVLLLGSDDSRGSVIQLAGERCPGLSYCLEISIARDAVEVWSQWHGGQQAGTTERAEAICYKANTDAWGPPNFTVQKNEEKG